MGLSAATQPTKVRSAENGTKKRKIAARVRGASADIKPAIPAEVVPVTTHVPVADISRFRSRAKISSKGQITLPLQVRNRLGIDSGDQVEFFFDGERTVVRPVRPEKSPFAKWVGIAKNVPAGYDPIADQREMRGWDEWDHEQYG